jgi:hypothetical protein
VGVVFEVIIDGASITIPIAQPFRPDLDDIIARIERLAVAKEVDIAALDVRGLISEMIKGVVGCERGCPADAKGLISRGYKGFDLAYVEGGILTARSTNGNASLLHLKMFPDF